MTINNLLREVATHLEAGTKGDKRAAFTKLQSIASIASTLAYTIKLGR